MDNVILTGPRYSGKTDIGKHVSHMLSAGFIDADDEFEMKHGLIDDYVASNGWLAFRKAESGIIEDLCALRYRHRVVFSLGGGAVAHDNSEELRLRNIQILKEFGKIFYLLPYSNLRRSAEVLDSRKSTDPRSVSRRPALTTAAGQVKTTLELLRERDPRYRQAADHVILTSTKTPYESAGLIGQIINSH